MKLQTKLLGVGLINLVVLNHAISTTSNLLQRLQISAERAGRPLLLHRYYFSSLNIVARASRVITLTDTTSVRVMIQGTALIVMWGERQTVNLLPARRRRKKLSNDIWSCYFSIL